MKNVSIILIVILFSFSSCQKDENIESSWECLPCGTYDILVDGTLHTPLFSFPIDSVPSTLIVEALDSNSINVSFNLAPILGTPDTSFLTVSGCTFDGTNLDGQSSFSYNDSVTIDILLISNLSNTYQNIQGTIDLSNQAVADFEFVGVKQ